MSSPSPCIRGFLPFRPSAYAQQQAQINQSKIRREGRGCVYVKIGATRLFVGARSQTSKVSVLSTQRTADHQQANSQPIISSYAHVYLPDVLQYARACVTIVQWMLLLPWRIFYPWMWASLTRASTWTQSNSIEFCSMPHEQMSSMIWHGWAWQGKSCA